MDKIEIISWRDACDFRGPESDYGKLLPTVNTIGINVFEDEHKVILVNHYGDDNKDEFAVSDEKEGVCIPKSWIIKRQYYDIRSDS